MSKLLPLFLGLQKRFGVRKEEEVCLLSPRDFEAKIGLFFLLIDRKKIVTISSAKSGRTVKCKNGTVQKLRIR